jgi:Family of unknown function (DUF5683)
MYIRPNSEGVSPLRRIFSTALFALGMAGLLRAADTAPAAPSSSPSAAPQSAPAASAPAPASAAPASAATPVPADSAKPKPAAPAAPAKRLSKKAKAAADSVARADSLAAAAKAAAAADSLRAAQAKADSARAAAAADSLRADSARQAEARAKAASDSARIAAAEDSVSADSAVAKSKKRKRIGRETTVNTIDELKGHYRSPKKALFMSLIVPGLGQAYVGHSWFNYARGAAYFLGDVALAYGWHYYVGVKQDREIKKYQTFADSTWRQWKYEDSVQAYKDKSKDLNQHRESYCDAVQSRNSSRGALLHGACIEPDKSSEYPSFKNEFKDTGTAAEVGAFRAAFPNAQQFYEMIGKENEFITGWIDAPAMKTNDSAWYAVNDSGTVVQDASGRRVLATTPYQQRYVGMRAQANDYARMQAWFLGGMVVNHIVSAVDAALTARYHNKALYQSETYWYDRIHLDSRLAWDGLAPIPTVTASFTF